MARRFFAMVDCKIKAVREGLTEEETDEMAPLKQKIPAEYLVDYEKRRIFNAEVDLTNIRLVETGVIGFSGDSPR